MRRRLRVSLAILMRSTSQLSSSATPESLAEPQLSPLKAAVELAAKTSSQIDRKSVV